MKIERRLRDRGADAAQARWFWKMLGVTVLGTILLFSFILWWRSKP